MADKIQKNILDPKTTYSNRQLFYGLIIVVIIPTLSWGFLLMAQVNNVETNAISNTKIINTFIEKFPTILEKKLEEKLDANNDKLTLAFDKRYEKKK